MPLDTMPRVSEICVYMIKKTDDLDREFGSGGDGAVVSGNPWTQGKSLYESAARKGEGFPIVFASADDESGLLYWAIVDGMDIDLHGRTTCRYAELRRVDGEPPINTLQLRSGRHLSANFRHGYALCRTPSFIG